MGNPLFIGVDVGTTNGKVACFDASGHVYAQAAHTYPTHLPRPGWYEQDPNDWLVALRQGLSEVVVQLGPLVRDVAGLALSNHVTGLVLMDEQGEPLAPSPTWQDKRFDSQGERLLREVGSGWVGLSPPRSGFPAKLLWAIEEQPELVERAALIADNKGFLYHWLTGLAATDPSCAPGNYVWWKPAFDHIGWPIEKLPEIHPSTSSPAGLRKAAADAVGLPAGTPVFTGLNDGAAAVLGSGAVRLSDSVTTLATNCASLLVSPNRLDPDLVFAKHLFSWPYVDGLWICGGFTCSGAGSLQWLADLLGVPREKDAYDSLLDEAGTVPPGSRGVIFMPYLAGRGTPEADPAVRGGFVRVGLEHGRAEFTRAVLEGVTYALREVYDELARLGLEIGPIRLTGGGARSRLWRQIIADILHQPVIHAGGDSTLGDAMVAAVGLGVFADCAAAAEVMVVPLAHEEPLAEAVSAYRRLLEDYAAVRDTFVPVSRTQLT